MSKLLISKKIQKSTCSKIVALTFILLLFTQSSCFAIEFTPEEQSYIQNSGKIKVCVDPDWVPFESINEQGEHEGIAADLLKLISIQTKLQFELVKTKSWDESLEAAKTGKCQILSFLNQTPQRDKWLIFTDVLFSDPNVFITREEHPFIPDLSYFDGESMVFPSGTAMEELVRTKYPNLKFITVDTENEAMKLVSNKKVDMTMRSLIVAAYTIKKEGLFNLKISGQLPNYSNNLRIGVGKNELILRNILNKGISTITPQQKREIVNKNVSINVHTVTDYTLLFKVIVVFGILIFIVIYWNYKLKKYNKEIIKSSHTDTLTGLFNRTKLNLQFDIEFKRAKQYNSPLAVIIFDIDNFKKVNDEMGHLMGDKVLIAISKILKENIEKSDTIGRWGGEEFLAICTGKNIKEVVSIGDKIRKAVKEDSDLKSKRECTISAGIAILLPEDTMDSLINRADKELYQAKKNGKDQVCF